MICICTSTGYCYDKQLLSLLPVNLTPKVTLLKKALNAAFLGQSAAGMSTCLAEGLGEKVEAAYLSR